MFTAHINNEKIAEELLAQTRSPRSDTTRKRNRTQSYNKKIRLEVKQQSQNKSRYTTLIHVAEIINRIVKATIEAGVASAADHIHVEIKTQ